MLMMVDLKAGTEIEAADAIAPFAAGAPQIFTRTTLAKPNAMPAPSAVEIADTVEPGPKQTMRREVLRELYSRYDTWHDQRGEPDPAFRNGTAALSRALRPFTSIESPLDILFTRERRLVATGPYKGRYEGTTYVPTELGKAVGEILKQRGVI